MGILTCRAGKVEVAGVDVAKLPSFERVARGIAYVPQGRMIFSTLTVLENIKTGLPKAAQGRVPAEIFDLFPVLYDMRDRRGGNCRAGSSSNLPSRALVTNPKVLLLDEPTEGIQPSIIKDIACSLKEIRDLRQLTIIVSEQVLSFTMEIADRLLVIEKGPRLTADPLQHAAKKSRARDESSFIFPTPFG
ncbi:ABC-type branched-subunit amino acid transport system ATPase component [Paraburkholderia sp. WC7.3g]|uniref:ATP-binding cassette domain-containing protein n=1 Tax=Paraburkholderia sp. WC7.3g TaxID=2991070 RepID=UPI003D24B57B